MNTGKMTRKQLFTDLMVLLGDIRSQAGERRDEETTGDARTAEVVAGEFRETVMREITDLRQQNRALKLKLSISERAMRKAGTVLEVDEDGACEG